MSRSFTASIISIVLFFALCVFTLFDVMIIEGQSMEPAYYPGQIIWINRCAYGLQLPFTQIYVLRWGSPEAGDAIVFPNPKTGELVLKRCHHKVGDRIFAVGDNRSHSTDSRDYGYIKEDIIYGNVMCQF